jgi:hypothetical protein
MKMHPRDKLFLILFPVSIVLCALFFIAIKLNERRVAQTPAIPVTFDTIASHKGEKVSIEGRIVIGATVSGSNECGCDLCKINNDTYRSCFRLRLLSAGDYDPTRPVVYIYMYDTTEDKREPNHFSLSMYYEKGEFRVYTNNGQEFTEDDPIRVIGFVCSVLEGNDGVVHVDMCVKAIEAVE